MLAAGAGTADYAAHLGAVLEGPDGKDDAARVIVGHSFGCRVAIRFACRWPDRVDALVLIAAAGLKRKRSLRFRLRAMLLRWLGKFYGVIDAVFRTDTKAAYREKFGSTDYKNAGELRATFVTTINEDLSELAGQLRCPVLLIYGSDDSETPVELGERYERLIPNATLKVLDHFAHLDILGAGRQQMATLIRRFLGE